MVHFHVVLDLYDFEQMILKKEYSSHFNIMMTGAVKFQNDKKHHKSIIKEVYMSYAI